MSGQKFLSTNSISALQKLLGKTIHSLWAPNLDAAGAHLAAWTLSMHLGQHSFMNFSCEWHETPKFLNDSWLITVKEDSSPLNIARNDTGAFLGVCNINIYFAKPIKRIEIFAYTNSTDNEDPEETVNYDQAILFTCEGGRAFCIGCMLNGPGIATYLHFSEDQSVIQTIVEHSTVRLTLT
jgi:hypothetical protein